MEKDDEIKGSGNWLQFGDFGYDSRIIRRNNTDPVVKEWQGGYVTFANNPIYYADPTGYDEEHTGAPQPESDSYNPRDWTNEELANRGNTDWCVGDNAVNINASRLNPYSIKSDNTTVANKIPYVNAQHTITEAKSHYYEHVRSLPVDALLAKIVYGTIDDAWISLQQIGIGVRIFDNNSTTHIGGGLASDEDIKSAFLNTSLSIIYGGASRNTSALRVSNADVSKSITDLVGHRRIHILNRHRAGSNIHDKTEFPVTWSDDKIINSINEIANNPYALGGTGKWNSPYKVGTIDGVEIRVDFYPKNHPKYAGQVSTGYPINP
jgi:hypothetical protein